MKKKAFSRGRPRGQRGHLAGLAGQRGREVKALHLADRPASWPQISEVNQRPARSRGLDLATRLARPRWWRLCSGDVVGGLTREMNPRGHREVKRNGNRNGNGIYILRCLCPHINNG